jgi:hypothetical protein
MNTLTLTVPVSEGRCQFSDAQVAAIRAFVERFNGKTVSVTWSKPKSTRSLRANAYYFGVVLTTISQETGNDVMDLHEAYKLMFITPTFVKLGDREIEVRRTTTDLGVAGFAKYVDDIVAHAGRELGISIPAPH